ncbi:MAG TPA: hypothetical protein VF108_07995 [Actinomycetota bacterium]
MAERTIVVCDVCGKPATETVTIKTSRGNYAKDLCAQHVTELTAGARKPKPGRPRKMGETSAEAPRRRGRPRKTAAASGRTTRKSARRKTARRTTRRKAQASAS